jgi:hypothetical protein
MDPVLGSIEKLDPALGLFILWTLAELTYTFSALTEPTDPIFLLRFEN